MRRHLLLKCDVVQFCNMYVAFVDFSITIHSLYPSYATWLPSLIHSSDSLPLSDISRWVLRLVHSINQSLILFVFFVEPLHISYMVKLGIGHAKNLLKEKVELMIHDNSC